MKKLSLLIAMILCLTIGGVYATWTYTKDIDVADESINMKMNLGSVEYLGSYGTYKVNADTLKLTIEPAAGTTHDTSLVVTGEIVITFTPNTVAPETVKDNGVESTFQFTLSSDDWNYKGNAIISLNHPDKHDITWVKQADGTFTYTLSNTDVASHLSLNTVTLDTKALYDEYNTALGQGSVIITVSDGLTTSTPTPPEEGEEEQA